MTRRARVLGFGVLFLFLGLCVVVVDIQMYPLGIMAARSPRAAFGICTAIVLFVLSVLCISAAWHRSLWGLPPTPRVVRAVNSPAMSTLLGVICVGLGLQRIWEVSPLDSSPVARAVMLLMSTVYILGGILMFTNAYMVWRNPPD